MSNFEVKVYKLKIEPHTNADTLEIACIDGYKSCVRKSEFKTGDLGVYIPEASIVPEWMLEKMNLVGKLSGSQKNRVKIIKLRSQISQGLIYPLIPFEGKWMLETVQAPIKFPHPSNKPTTLLIPVTEGQDVADILGIRKYEPAIPSQLGGNRTKQIGSDKTIKNWDVENIKKYHKVLEEGEEVVATEKLHGCADYNTLIDTVEYGPLQIGTIVENAIECHVKSMDILTGEIEFNEIINWSCQDNLNNWFELTLEDGTTIKLTGNHLVWLPELNAYRTVEDLTEDDIVLVD